MTWFQTCLMIRVQNTSCLMFFHIPARADRGGQLYLRGSAAPRRDCEGWGWERWNSPRDQTGTSAPAPGWRRPSAASTPTRTNPALQASESKARTTSLHHRDSAVSWPGCLQTFLSIPQLQRGWITGYAAGIHKWCKFTLSCLLLISGVNSMLEKASTNCVLTDNKLRFGVLNWKASRCAMTYQLIWCKIYVRLINKHIQKLPIKNNLFEMSTVAKLVLHP